MIEVPYHFDLVKIEQNGQEFTKYESITLILERIQ